MKKDIIYIDVEDDITDIVSKVKASRESIVALMPPKRIGILQSVVNLKLIARTAKTMKKHVVIISSNPALEPLAAVAKIPLAKTLQSRPMIPVIAGEDKKGSGIEVIDGEKIPIGEFAGKKIESDDDASVNEEVIDTVVLEDDEDGKAKKKKQDAKKKVVPDFGKFRKKVFIAIAGVAMVAGVLVWALVFAPAAEVIVLTRTTSVDFEETVSMTTNEADVDVSAGILGLRRFELSKKAEVEFEVTGTKDVGERASGTIQVTRGADTGLIMFTPLTIPAGAMFIGAGGQAFVSTNAVTIVNNIGPPPSFGTATVNVVAVDIGEEYNVAAQNYTISLGGGFVVTAVGSEMTGGSRRTIRVVTEEDVERATEQLTRVDESAARQELFRNVSETHMPIEVSLMIDVRDPVVSPDVDEEVSGGRATLTAETILTVYGIDRAHLEELIEERLEEKIGQETGKKIYDFGLDRAFVRNCVMAGAGGSCRVSTVAQIGPEITEEMVRDKARGNRFGEVQRQLEAIDGVAEVDVQFSYFWVRVVPQDDRRITVRIEASE